MMYNCHAISHVTQTNYVILENERRALYVLVDELL